MKIRAAAGRFQSLVVWSVSVRVSPHQLEFRERIAELISQVANEKRAFEESLARFQEKGKALKAALDTARTAASGNIAALREKHKVREEKSREIQLVCC